MMLLLLMAGLLLFTSPLPLRAQESKESQNPFRELLAKMTPEARLKYERLRKAEFASLELARRPLELGENPERLKDPYKEGDRIYFRLLITNNSIEKVSFARVDFYQEQRPDLSRDGDPVPYRKRISELLVQKDRDIMGRRVSEVTLQAGETTEEFIDLADWYEPLQSGHYQLTLRRRFIWGGDWIESPAITFEVEPKRDRANKESKHGDL
jgi:hypothetical protein